MMESTRHSESAQNLDNRGYFLQIIPLFILIALFYTSCAGTNAAWKAYEAKDYEKTKQLAARILIEEPKNAEIYRLIALTHIAEGNHTQAIAAARLAASFSDNADENLAVLQTANELAQDWTAFCDLERLRSTSKSRRDYDQALYERASKESLKQNPAAAYGCYLRGAEQNATLRSSDEYQKSAASYAELLAQNGQYRPAIELLETLQNPQYRDFQVGKYQYVLQKRDDAQQRFDAYLAAAQSSEDKAQYAENIADFYALERSYDLAAKYYAQSQLSSASHKRLKLALEQRKATEVDAAIVAIEAGSPMASPEYVDLAKTLASNGYADKASSILERAQTKFPQNGEIKLQLASTYEQLGKVREREALLNAWANEPNEQAKNLEQIFYWYNARQYWREARATGEKRIVLGAAESKFLMDLAQVYAHSRDYDDMERMLDQAIATAAAKNEQVRETRITAAKLAQKHYSWRKSALYLASVIKEEPANKEAAWLLAKAYEYEQAEERAFETLMSWAKASDNEAQALLEIARSYDKQQYHEQFERSMKVLLTKDSLQFEAHLLNAQHAVRLGDDDAALQSCMKAIDVSSDKKSAYEHVIEFLDQSVGSAKLAIIMAHNAIAYDPKNPRFYYTLADLQLRSGEGEMVYDSLSKYLEYSDNKAEATRSAILTLGRFKREGEALDWVNQQAKSYASDPEMLVVLGNYYSSMYLSHQSREPVLSQSYRAQAFKAYDAYIHASSNVLELQNLGVHLCAQEDYASAERAFARARSLAELMPSAKSYEIYALLGLGKTKEAKARIADFAKSENETKNILALAQELSNRRYIDEAAPLFEKLINADSAELRSIAYRRVVSLAIDQGAKHKIFELSERYSRQKPLTITALEDLFYTWMEIEDWQRALNVWEQMAVMRPNAGDLLTKLLNIRAVEGENGLAQPILERHLQNIAVLGPALYEMGSFYDKRGENISALQYYRRSLAVSQFPSPDLLRRSLILEILLGDDQVTSSLIQKLKQSGAWDLDTVLATAEAYQESGNTELAQDLIDEAFAEKPKAIKLHALRIDQAFQNGEKNKALQYAQEYIDAGLPSTLLIDILARNNAIDEAIFLIDELKTAALFDESLHKTLEYEAEIAQQRGNTAYVMELRSLAQNSAYSLPAYRKLVQLSLAQNNTSEAANYALDSSSSALQIETLALEPTQHTRLLDVIEAKQNELRSSQRLDFSQKTISTLQNLDQNELAFDLAFQGRENRQIELNTAQIALNEGRINDAMSIFYTGSFSDLLTTNPSAASSTQFFRVLELISSYQYPAYAAALAKDWYQAQGENPQLEEALWKANIVLSSQAKIDVKAPENSRSRLLFWAEQFPHKVNDKQLELMRKSPLPQEHAQILKAHVIYAANNPKERHKIKDILEDFRHKSSNPLYVESPLLEYSQESELHDLAYHFAKALSSKRPRVVAFYLAQMEALRGAAKSEEAVQALKEAAKRDAHPMRLLKEQLQKFDKPEEAALVLPLVEQITVNEPHNKNLALLKLALLLRQEQFAKAEDEVKRLVKYNKSPQLLARIVQCYEENNSLHAIPDVYLKTHKNNDESLALIAAVELKRNNYAQAAHHYIMAAEQSLNALKFWNMGANAFVDANNMQYAEQLSERALLNYPNAPAPRLIRAKIRSAQNNTQAALEDFAYALTHSSEPTQILADFAYFLISKGKVSELPKTIDFAKKQSVLSKNDLKDAITKAFGRAQQEREGAIFLAQYLE
ncbi:MAG: hypothetical protein WC966_08135 [Bradymonadales bacterium]